MRLICPSKSVPRVLALHWFERSRLAVHPPRGLQTRDTRPYYRSGSLPRAFIPLQSFTRRSPLPFGSSTALSRFFAPSAQTSRPSHRSRAYLTRVTLRPCGSSPPRRLSPMTASPVSFNRARSRGSPFRALPDEGLLAFRRDLPSCDWRTRWCNPVPTEVGPRCVYIPGAFMPRLSAPHVGFRFPAPSFRSVPGRSRTGIREHFPASPAWQPYSASLQGFPPFVRWGHRFRISPAPRHPGSPGILLLEAFPIPGLGHAHARRARLPGLRSAVTRRFLRARFRARVRLPGSVLLSGT